MRPEYITALEQRLAWLKWAKSEEGHRMWSELGYSNAMPSYVHVLEHADLFCMTAPFEDLVDHARRTLPDDLAFDTTWMQSQWGFLWLQQPFDVGTVEKTEAIEALIANRTAHRTETKVRAIGWFPLAKGTVVRDAATGVTRATEADAFHILTFQDLQSFNQPGFGCWSYMSIEHGEKLTDRIKRFEEKQTSGKYVNREQNPLHELRWAYAAFYLMNQKLSTTLHQRPDRSTRRRLAREKAVPPEFLRIVTLRRLEEARTEENPHDHVEWQWRWAVRGHWRNQYHPSTGAHSPVFIESYIKGPSDRPMKPDTLKLFVARR